MSTWAGWQADLLDAAGVPNTTRNRVFMTAWEKAAPTSCYRNPVWISHKQTGSTNCRKLPNVGGYAQKYLSVNSGKDAFAKQLNSGRFEWLQKALESGNPYAVYGTAAVAVAQNLDAWGSPKFSTAYTRTQTQPTGVIAAPQSLKGWADLRKSINRGMPVALGYSQHLTTKSLRTLARARKVKI